MRTTQRNFRGRGLNTPMSLVQQALSILRRPGIEAHVYLPGIGTLSGLQAANYLDSVGTTPATVDQPVGLVLDAAGSVGVELVTLLSGWSALNGGSAGVSGPALTVTTSATAFSGASQTIACIVAGTYRVAITASVDVTTSWQVAISGIGASVINYSAGQSAVREIVFTATATAHNITCYASASGVAGAVITVQALSIKQVTGTHATQPTTAAKPRLERGVRNLLLQSVLPAGTAGTVGSGAVAPTSWVFINTGGTVAFQPSITGNGGAVRFVASGTRPAIGQSVAAIVAGGVYTQSFRVDSVASGSQTAETVSTMGGVTSTNTCKINGITVPPSTTLVTGDRVAMTFSVSVATSPQVRLGPGANGAATGDITLSNIMLEVGSTASDYSPTTTAAASNPSAGKYSWAFDGGDSLALGSVPFQMSDDHAVIAGFTCSNDAAARVVTSVYGAATTAFAAQIYQLTNTVIVEWRDDASATCSPAAQTVPVGTTVVISGRRVGNTSTSRKNGGNALTATATLGASTLNTAAIGANRFGNNMQGSTGPILAIKGTLTDSEMLTLERFASSLTPNGPTF